MSSSRLGRSTLVAAALAMGVATSVEAQRRIVVPPDSTAMRTWIGMGWSVRDPMEPPDQRRAPVVRSVVPCSPVHYAGLEPGDLLLTVNGRDVREGRPFPGDEGTEYRVDVERGGERLTVVFKRTRRPEEARAPVEAAPIGSPDEWDCSNQGF